MSVTFGVCLGTRQLTVSDHTAQGHLTSSGIGWAACCMIMTTMVIVTWWLLFQSVVHSQIAPCHRLQAYPSYVLLARHKRMSPAVPWHPLLTGSLDMRQWPLLKMTQSFWLSVVEVVMVVGDPVIWLWLRAAKVNKMLKSIFTGAVFEIGSAPVFNFNGNFNLFWLNILHHVSLLFLFISFSIYFLRCLTFAALLGMNDNNDNWDIAMRLGPIPEGWLTSQVSGDRA